MKPLLQYDVKDIDAEPLQECLWNLCYLKEKLQEVLHENVICVVLKWVHICKHEQTSN